MNASTEYAEARRNIANDVYANKGRAFVTNVRDVKKRIEIKDVNGNIEGISYGDACEIADAVLATNDSEFYVGGKADVSGDPRQFKHDFHVTQSAVVAA